MFLWNEAEDSSIIETTLFLLKSPKPFEYGRLSHYSGNMLGGLIPATASGSASVHRSGSGSAERQSSRKDIPYQRDSGFTPLVLSISIMSASVLFCLSFFTAISDGDASRDPQQHRASEAKKPLNYTKHNELGPNNKGHLEFV